MISEVPSGTKIQCLIPLFEPSKGLLSLLILLILCNCSVSPSPICPNYPSELQNQSLWNILLKSASLMILMHTKGCKPLAQGLLQSPKVRTKLTTLKQPFSLSCGNSLIKVRRGVLPCKWVHQYHGYVVISHCAFNLYFPNGKYW